MLTSFYYKDGKPLQIVSLNLSEENVSTIKKKKIRFRCPCCGEETIFKSGVKKVSHFAHAVKGDCPDLGETEIHIRTKLAIYNSLVGTLGKGNVHLEKIFRPEKDSQELFEKYKESINAFYTDYLKVDSSSFEKTQFFKYVKRGFAIPDVSFEVNGQKVVVEIQKSKIDEQEFYARTLFYQTFGVGLLWIVPEEEIYESATRGKNNPHCVYRNMPNLWRQMKKYSFGKLYTFDRDSGFFKMWNVDNVETQREGYDNYSTGFSSSGYSYSYKKLKYFKPVFRTKDLVTNFGIKLIEKNDKYRMPINALIYMPMKSPS